MLNKQKIPNFHPSDLDPTPPPWISCTAMRCYWLPLRNSLVLLF